MRSLTSLAMLTGNLGKAHVGVNPVRGQNNVQGACDMGALPDTYPGYQYVKFPENREVCEGLGRGEPAGTHRVSHQRAAAPRGAR